MQFQKRTSFEQVPIRVALRAARAEFRRTEAWRNPGGRMNNPVCVECKNEKEPVTPENGVWIPDRNGVTVPAHKACAAQRTIRVATQGD